MKNKSTSRSRSPQIYDESDSDDKSLENTLLKLSEVDQIIDVFKSKIKQDIKRPTFSKQQPDTFHSNYGMFDPKSTNVPSIINVPNEQTKKLRNQMIAKLQSNRTNHDDLKNSSSRKTITKKDFTEDPDEEKLHEIHDAIGRFQCKCSVCTNQIRGKLINTVHKMPEKLKTSLSIIDRDAYYKRFQGQKMDFAWLIEHLLPFSDRIKGCECIFPDTIFFKNGKPHMIVKMDKDFCLQAIKSGPKLNLHNIMKDIQNITRERKRDTHGVFALKYGAEILESAENAPKFNFQQDTKMQQALIKLEAVRASSKDLQKMTMTKKHHAHCDQGEDEDKSAQTEVEASKQIDNARSPFYKDVAIIRFNPDTDFGPISELGPSVQVVTDNGLMYIFQKKSNDGYWKTINAIQTNIKSKIGMGSPITVKFYANIDRNNPDETIIYDFKSFGEDMDLIRNNEEKYCLKQAYKICFYVSKLYQYEIIKMKCEFVKDDNNTIWLQYVQDIVVRPNAAAKVLAEKQLQALKKINETKKEKIKVEIKTMQEFDKNQVQMIEEIMDQQYQKVREKVNIQKLIDPSDSDEETEQAYHQLRPNSKYTLKTILNSKKMMERTRPKNLRYPVGKLNPKELEAKNFQRPQTTLDKNGSIQSFEIQNANKKSRYLQRIEERKIKANSYHNVDLLGQDYTESIIETKSNFTKVLPVVETNITEGYNIPQQKIVQAQDFRNSQLSKRSGLKLLNNRNSSTSFLKSGRHGNSSTIGSVNIPAYEVEDSYQLARPLTAHPFKLNFNQKHSMKNLSVESTSAQFQDNLMRQIMTRQRKVNQSQKTMPQAQQTMRSMTPMSVQESWNINKQGLKNIKILQKNQNKSVEKFIQKIQQEQKNTRGKIQSVNMK